MDWKFFMDNRKAKRMARVLGYTGARIFYCVLGAVIAVFGLLLFIGVVPV